jgi:hypothetical protein
VLDFPPAAVEISLPRYTVINFVASVVSLKFAEKLIP